MEYKEITGRPVYAYMAEVCASGGYWISMAADHIAANRMTMTGSIGVVWSFIDYSGLFDNLGLRTVTVDSGEHKSIGAMGTEITPNQVAVIQSMVDEYIDVFVEFIADGRNMNPQTVRSIADGRVYTARQAYDLGLIDEINGWDVVLSDFETLTGVSAFYPNLMADTSFWGMLAKVTSGSFSRSEVDIAMNAIDAFPRGVPLAIMPEYMG